VHLVFGRDFEVYAWVSKRFGRPVALMHSAIGIMDDFGKMIGAASLHDYNGSNVELVYWGPARLSLSRQLARYCFEGLKVNRVTARTPRGNEIVKRGLPKLGFIYEGTLRHYYGPFKRDDAILFGLLRKDAQRLLKDIAK